MYSLWWSNHIVLAYVSKVAKNLRVVCENIARMHKCLILWQFEIWENQIHSHIIITTWWGLSPSRYWRKIWFCIPYKTHNGSNKHGSISFMIDNMHYVNFRIWEQDSVPWSLRCLGRYVLRGTVRGWSNRSLSCSHI